jgi:surface protein
MFRDLISLKSLSISSFNTNKVNDMFGMFKNSGLESIDISSFDTKKVTNMRDLFGNYISLKQINLNNFINEMFEGCILLESLNLSTFNTKIIEDARHLLNGRINLKDIDFSNIDSSNIK